jgi:putative transposase
MTLPRQFLPNATYFITRRTTQRQFWLKPTRQTNQIFLYCLAIAAEKTGVQLHCATVMSNHWHAIVTDPQMRVAEFYGWVHEYVAKAVNCSLGRWENLWSTDKTSVIPLESAEDVLDKTAYTLCNPVSAHLIARAENWKGVWLYRQSHSQTVPRPSVYFQSDGNMPEFAELKIHQPPSHGNMSTHAYERLVADEIAHREQTIACEMRETGKSFMGMDAVLRQAHSDNPRSFAPKRKLNPRFSAINKWLKITAIKRYKR